VSVLTSFDLVAGFKNITELKKRLHLTPYEMILLENNAFKKILEILIPKFEKEKLKMRRFSLYVEQSFYFSELIRSLESFIYKIDLLANEFDQKLMLTNIGNALEFTKQILQVLSKKSSTKETTDVPDLTKKELFQMAHQTIINFKNSKNFEKIIQKYDYSEIHLGSYLKILFTIV
jgi:hypothetical protein